MKTKFFFAVKTLCYAVLAMAAVSFSSCSKDDDDDNNYVNEIVAKQQAHLTVKMTEDHFEYGDFIVTMEYDGTKQEYRMSEATRMNDDLHVDGASFECRVLEIPEFEYKTPVKLYTKFVLNEAGRQKIANANDEMVSGFGLYINFDYCTAPGQYDNIENTIRPNTHLLRNLDKTFETQATIIGNVE